MRKNVGRLGLQDALWCCMALALVSLAFCVALFYGYDMWHYERLDFQVPLIRMMEEGAPMSAFLRHANIGLERTPVTLLLFLLLSMFGRHMMTAQLVLTPVFACITALFLSRLSHRAFRDSSPADRGVFLLIIWAFLLSVLQWETWTRSFLDGTLVTLLAVAAAAVLSRESLQWRHILVALLLGIACTFTRANGVAVWVALLPLLLYRQEAKRYIFLLAWLGTAFVSGFLLFVGRIHILAGTAPPDAMTLFRIVRFALTALGAPLFAQSASLAFLFGAVMLLSVVWLFYSKYAVFRTSRPLQAWLSMFLFACFTSMTIALARVDAGIGQALISRYITLTVLGVIAWVHLIHLTAPVVWRPALRCAWLLALLSLLLLSKSLLPAISADAQYFARGKLCGETYHIASDDCLGILHGSAEFAREQLHTLDELGYLKTLDFQPSLTMFSSSLRYSGAFDGLYDPVRQGGRNAYATQSLIAWGWTIGERCEIPDLVVLTHGSGHTLLAAALPIAERPDVAAVHGTCYLESGWSVAMQKDVLENIGDAPIDAWVYDRKRREAFLLQSVEPLPVR
mgnify:CR=1 FL=1